MQDRMVIAGVGHTTYGRHEGRDKIALKVEAVRKALADAGVPKDQVDALLVKTPNAAPEILYGQKVAEALGLKPKLGCCWDQGGAANIALITYGSQAIQAGQARIAVICFGDTPRSASRAVYHRPHGNDAVYGLFSTAAGYALIHQAYREKYKVEPEAFGAVAVACREHGAKNPNAQLRKAITMADYMASPFIVEPLRRDDCCLVSDGAAAIVVMAELTAKEMGITRYVPILGLGQGQESWGVPLRADLTTTCAKTSAATAFKMAGMSPRDIDIAQIYDCFTITVLMTLEDYGFCKPGQAGAFVRDMGIGIEGKLPLNTSGGLLSETGTPGLQLIIEGVRQMRGEANLQKKGAKTCVISNQGGSMHTHATMILGAAQ